jgi:hypothetical protein
MKIWCTLSTAEGFCTFSVLAQGGAPSVRQLTVAREPSIHSKILTDRINASGSRQRTYPPAMAASSGDHLSKNQFFYDDLQVFF